VTIALPHPLTFLARLARPAQLRASWYMALFQVPGAGALVGDRLVDRLWRAWSPGFSLDAARRAELYACLRASMPAPLGYYRAMRRISRARVHALAAPIRVPLLQLHGARDGCVLPPGDDDARRFAAPRVYEVVRDAGHFLHLEQPAAVAARIAAWMA
jgi:pimeloyl-ACP methyl ester carboxylesterase